MDNFSYDFQPGERIGIIGKNGTENQLLNLLTDHFRLMVEKW
jgi:ATP-binding cassette subfamily F protein uup